MYILAAGINYRTAPVEIREKFTFTKDEVPDVLQKIRSMNSIMECSLVATCNRTEFYFIVDNIHCGEQNLLMFLQEYFNTDRSEFRQYLYTHANERAIIHLFKVACGLDSMVLGETQILGQVREAYDVALANNTIGTILKQLLPHAICVGKRCHTETDIGKNAVSISYAAIELAKKIFGQLNDKQVLIIGAGKMSELTAKHLNSSGVEQVYVVNRTYQRAQELAEKFNGIAVEWENIEDSLSEVDIVVSSTGATDFVIDKKIMERVMIRRKNRPIFMIDIAVPRDLDPEINEVDGVFLYDIDELEGVVEANKKLREQEVNVIDTIIEEEIDNFSTWLDTLEVIPLIKALKHKTDAIYENTMESLYNKLPDLSEREKKVIRKHTKSIINQILKQPITHAKEVAGKKYSKEQIELIAEIFGVLEEPCYKANVVKLGNRKPKSTVCSVKSEKYLASIGRL
ncbi:glutamyl-tRNA reductase [Desulfuribacillus alkaliarsenatis]|uniref:Glutamyl-tRNA reductase n=1 Tax=Desulfuribacillus alkaliarsenatis TaxID=766136 RepID=A0A1E5G562_9FIRM|nr:glutamyl-tRNA reductase [Desulfuribacillus alkaliarsenatis]OEF98308.1 glutamyl-tRNA reductase [Desulfuribacillus alkaliarsenatis]